MPNQYTATSNYDGPSTFTVKLSPEERRLNADLSIWLEQDRSTIYRITLGFLHGRASEYRQRFPNVPLNLSPDDVGEGLSWEFMRAYYDARKTEQTNSFREAREWLDSYHAARRISGENFKAHQVRAETALLVEARKMWAAGVPIDSAWLRGESRPSMAAPAPARPAASAPPAARVPAAPAPSMSAEIKSELLQDDGLRPVAVVDEVPLADREEPETLDELAKRVAAMDAARAARRAAPGARGPDWRLVLAVVVLGVLAVVAGWVGMSVWFGMAQ